VGGGAGKCATYSDMVLGSCVGRHWCTEAIHELGVEVALQACGSGVQGTD
jgi:hypothetical protein